MFAQPSFIEASRKFVCVRLETYESKKHQDMVRSFLNGRFENTAFCLLAPDGKTRLTRSARSPNQVLSAAFARTFPEHENENIIFEMNQVAEKYSVKDAENSPVMQDFHTFRQALNVASGDQRLLFFVSGKDRAPIEARLASTFNDPEIVGKFHTDFIEAKGDEKWSAVISGTTSTTGLFVIQSDTYGMKGHVLAQLPLEATAAEVKNALLTSNKTFAAHEKRKVYSQHVSAARRTGIHFKNAMPYGEDRDADGKIDHVGGRRR